MPSVPTDKNKKSKKNMKVQFPMRIAAFPLALLASLAAAADPVETEIARYQESAARLQKVYDDGAARERARSLPVLVNIAKREAGQGNIAGASEVWKQVLALDSQHDDARKFFTGTNQLDAVLAELAKPNPRGQTS